MATMLHLPDILNYKTRVGESKNHFARTLARLWTKDNTPYGTTPLPTG